MIVFQLDLLYFKKIKGEEAAVQHLAAILSFFELKHW